jgi:hypothetical protein
VECHHHDRARERNFNGPHTVRQQIRADQIFVEGLRLPYFTFPRNPEDL